MNSKAFRILVILLIIMKLPNWSSPQKNGKRNADKNHHLSATKTKGSKRQSRDETDLNSLRRVSLGNERDSSLHQQSGQGHGFFNQQSGQVRLPWSYHTQHQQSGQGTSQNGLENMFSKLLDFGDNVRDNICNPLNSQRGSSIGVSNHRVHVHSVPLVNPVYPTANAPTTYVGGYCDYDELMAHLEQEGSTLKAHGYQKISKNDIVVNSRAKSMWQNAFRTLSDIKNQITSKKHTFKGLERRMLAFAAIQSPKASQQTVATIMHYTRMATIGHLGLSTEEKLLGDHAFLEDVCRASVGEDSIGDMILDLATDILFRQRNLLLQPYTSVAYLGVDKGPRGDFVKIVTYYNSKTKKIEVFILDNEGSGGTNIEAAYGILHTTERLQLPEGFCFGGFTSDSGGGGTRDGLMKYLKEFDIIGDNGLVGTCSLHCLQLLLSNPCLAYIGKGGIERRNALQLIHAVFDLQDTVGTDEWRSIIRTVEKQTDLKWQNVSIGKDNEENFIEKMKEAVLTRWWTVGQAARLIVANIEILKSVIMYCITMQRPERDTAASTIASRLLSMFTEDTIISDLKFIHCFNNAFLSKHFEWLQGGDERVGNTPGFYSRLMLERYFLMYEDLKKWSNDGWKKDPGMKLFFDTFRDDEEEPTQIEDSEEDEEDETDVNYSTSRLSYLEDLDVDGNKAKVVIKIKTEKDGTRVLEEIKNRPLNAGLQAAKARKFIDRALILLHKHFDRYVKQHLFLGLFGEKQTASILAEKILLISTAESGTSMNVSIDNAEEADEFIHSNFQRCDINLTSFREFLDEFVDVNKVKECPHINESIGIARIAMIAGSTTGIWEATKDEATKDKYPALVKICNIYLGKYAALLSSTHCVEAAVKKSADANNGCRSETRQSQYVLGSNLKSVANQRTIERKENSGKEYKSKIKARGKDAFIEGTVTILELHQEVEVLKKDKENLAVWTKIKETFKDQEKAFKMKRVKKRLKEWADRAIKRRGRLKGTKLAHEEGFDVTDELLDRVTFADVKKKYHENLLKDELRERNIEFTERTLFTTMRMLLRHDEIKRRKKIDQEGLDALLKNAQKKQEAYSQVTAFNPLKEKVDVWNFGTEDDDENIRDMP